MWMLLLVLIEIHLAVQCIRLSKKPAQRKEAQQKSGTGESSNVSKTPDEVKKEQKSGSHSHGSTEKVALSPLVNVPVQEPTRTANTGVNYTKAEKRSDSNENNKAERNKEVQLKECTAVERTPTPSCDVTQQADKTTDAEHMKTFEEERKKSRITATPKKKSMLRKRQSKDASREKEKKEPRTVTMTACSSERNKKTISRSIDAQGHKGDQEESSDSDTFKYVKSIRDLQPTC